MSLSLSIFLVLPQISLVKYHWSAVFHQLRSCCEKERKLIHQRQICLGFRKLGGYRSTSLLLHLYVCHWCQLSPWLVDRLIPWWWIPRARPIIHDIQKYRRLPGWWMVDSGYAEKTVWDNLRSEEDSLCAQHDGSQPVAPSRIRFYRRPNFPVLQSASI